MKIGRFALALFVTVSLAATASILAADGVEMKEKSPPPKEVSAEIAAALSPTAYQVTADGGLVAEIWLAKQWEAKAGFTPSLAVQYPLQVGDLIGAIRFPKPAGDFRKQEFRPGVYLLRYGLQPEDGNHTGTSETRDFLVLLPSSKDAKPARVEEKEMFKLSTDVTQTTHPAILSMVSIPEKAKTPAVRHIEDRKLWTVRLAGKAKTGDKVTDLPIEFVIVGHAPE
jgi:hypothetical protein